MTLPHMSVTQRFATADTCRWWERQHGRIIERLKAVSQRSHLVDSATHVRLDSSRNMGSDQ